MSNISVFCCLKGCLDGFKFNTNVPSKSNENPIQLDTAYMGYEVVIVKGGQRVCGAGAALGNAPLVQSKSYFEAKVQQGGTWSVGLATRQTDLSLTIGGMDQFSWALCSDLLIRHNKQELHKLDISNNITNSDSNKIINIQEGDIIGVSFDHIELKFYVNGADVGFSISNVKGTVYPAIYVDDGAIIDIILDNFSYAPPPGFDKIMIEQSLL